MHEELKSGCSECFKSSIFKVPSSCQNLGKGHLHRRRAVFSSRHSVSVGSHTHPIMPSNLCHKCLELSFSFILLKVFFTALYHLMLPSPLPGHVTRSTSETGGGRDDICLGRVCPGADEIGSKLADGMHHIYLYLYMGYIYIWDIYVYITIVFMRI